MTLRVGSRSIAGTIEQKKRIVNNGGWPRHRAIRFGAVLPHRPVTGDGPGGGAARRGEERRASLAGAGHVLGYNDVRDDLIRRVAAFKAQINHDPCAATKRDRVRDHLNPDEEKLRLSS